MQSERNLRLQGFRCLSIINGMASGLGWDKKFFSEKAKYGYSTRTWPFSVVQQSCLPSYDKSSFDIKSHFVHLQIGIPFCKIDVCYNGWRPMLYTDTVKH